MKYIRQFTRKQERNHTKTLEQQKYDLDLAKKVLATITAFSFIGNPFVAMASTITRVDAPNDNLMNGKNVGNIYAEKIVNNNTAVNRFDQFKIDAGHIANMYFRTQDSAWADNLVNFVNNRIDVAGTVNAIKENKIGGNLFFLSPNGMVVGKSGVINAGSLFAMAPKHGLDPESTLDEYNYTYEGLRGAFASGTVTDETLNRMMTLDIPLNSSGTISVLGTINAVGDVKLAAANVAVGKNVSGEDLVDGTTQGEIVNGAAIRTGSANSFNFSDLVNIKNSDGTIKTNAGLGDNLTAIETGSGDIVLFAKAEDKNINYRDFNDLGKEILDLTVNLDTPKTIEASVENYGTIKAKGNAVLKAEATNGNKDWAEETLKDNTPNGVTIPDYVPVPAANADNYVQVIAKVDVQGDITAGGDIALSADADNTYVDDGSSLTDNVGKVLGTGITPMAANVMILDNQAKVTVGKDAAITAHGTIDVHANAVLDGTAGAAANGRKLIKAVSDAIPSAAVGYARAENSAAVQIDGNLTAKGETVSSENNDNAAKGAVNISAYAEENLNNTATMNLKSGALGAGSSVLAASVAVSDSKNNADVTINGTVAAGDAVIKADTKNSLVTSAATKAPDDTALATAVNVITHSGHANIGINGNITAQDVTIDATNYTDENTITADNSLGMGKLMAEAMNAANVGGITNALKDNPLVQKIIKNDGTSTAEQPGLLKELSEKMAVGAAVVVADETNEANVTFGNTAQISATGGDIRTDADVTIYDSHLYASGTANSYKKDNNGNTDTVTVGTGVVYAGMNNNAAVVFEDGTAGEGNHASVTAAHDVAITSGTTMEYHRPERIKREIDRSIENLQYALATIKGLPEYEEEKYTEFISSLGTLKEKLENYAKTYSDEFVNAVDKPDAITAEGTASQIFDAASGAVGIYNDVMNLQQTFNDMSDVTSPFTAVVSNALGVVTNSIAFVDPNNYANVAASASAKGGTESTKLSVSGAVTVTDFSNTSSVKVGTFTTMQAGNTLGLTSDNTVEDVNITGKTKFWKNDADAKGGAGVGASVNYQNFDTDSNVIVQKGAGLTAGDISIGSDSNISHVGVMLGAGKSDGSAVNGMVTITDSDSYNNVIVDTDAVLKAIKAANTTGHIDIWANNNTNVNNAILSISASGANVGAGIGVAFNNIDVQNTAQIADIDSTDSEEDVKGNISASALSVNAETTGLINAISVAGGMTSSGESEDGEEGFFNKIQAPVKKVEETQTQALDGISNISNKLQDVLRTMNLNSSSGSISSGSATSDGGAGVPGFSLAGAGSVSLNLVGDTTKAVIDGAAIDLTDDGKLQVGARDSAFTGAWSGAAGLSFRKGQSGGSGGNTSVAVSGAVGVNDIDNEITALVKNSSITGAKDIDVTAVSGGTTVAAGIGATLTSDSTGGKNYSGGASVSVNLIDKDVNANMDGVTLTGVAEGEDKDQKAVTDIDVAAYESDVQVTGGVRADIATGGGSLVGGGVTVADIQNNINAGITGGSYTNVNDVTVKGMLATTQVTAAVSAGVATGGSGTNNAFSGAAVYNGLSNDIHASIDGANIIAEGTVAVAAKDTEAGSKEAEPYQNLLGDYKEHDQFAANRGIDTNGASYYTDLDTAGESVDYDGNKGSTIVGAAAVVAGSNGNAAGAAINIADIDNDFTASIQNADIKADTVLAEADADTLLVGASGGIAAGTKTFGGMGSVTWQDIDNDVTAQFVNSQITTNTVTAKADNNTQAINVAGSVSVGKSAAVGATLAYNALDNTIGAYMKGNSITALGDDVDVVVDADNTGKVYGIGAGVSASTKAAINGSVAVNRGGSNTEAVIDKSDEKESYIEDAGTVKVTADDDTYRLAVVGSVSASGKAAVGGGVAYNDVGGSSAGSESSGQNTLAAIKNTDITMADNGEHDVTVKANDASQLMTIAAGVAAAATAGVQGSAATSLVNKNVSALVENTDIDESGGSLAEVTVDAQNNSQITSSADTGSFAAQGAGVGAGVAVNRIVQQTNAAVNGGVMNVNNLTVQADGKPRIENIGVGIAVAGQGAGVSGSVAVNMIDNDVTAHIGSGANINTNGSVGVVAKSDEQISNYAGQVAVGAVGAGVGLSVSVNQITGTTAASVGGEGEAQTKVSAAGNGSGLTTDTVIDDTEINDEVISKDSVKIDAKIDRSQETRNGLIVDASSTRDLKSFLVTAGVAGKGAGVSGTVNVNQIDGATDAGIVNAAINGSVADGSAGNVYVNAGDYSNSSGFVGSAAVSGIGAGVGLGSDTNTVSRDVTATVQDSDIKADSFELETDAKQGISSLTIGVAAAGIGGGVSNATSVTLLDGKTTASVKNANITASNADILATHTSKLNTMGAVLGAAGMGAGVGVGVSVLNENSETTADVTDATISLADDAGDVNVKAENSTKIDYELYGIGGGLAGAAGAIGVSNVKSKVNTHVSDSSIGSEPGKAHDINIASANHIDFTNNSGSGAGGVAGVGVGVAVNTIDSQVNTSVGNSDLYAANDINVTAQETRKIEQMAANAQAGGAAAGANVMITNVGSAVAGSYGSGLQTDEDGNVKDGSGVNIDEIYDQANKAVEGNKLQSSYTNNQVAADDIKSAEAGRGGARESIVKVTIDDASLNAGNKVTADATADTSVSMDAIQASGGAVASANGTVGILNVHRNSVVKIQDAAITAKELAVSTTQKGVSGLDIYQGTLGGGAAIGAAYGSATSTGVNAIDIDGSTFDVDNDIAINAKDQSKTEVNAIGVTLSPGGAASVIVAEGTNDSETTVSVDDTTMNAGSDINVHAERKADGDSLSVSAIAASGGLTFAGAGVSAIANEFGKVGAEITGGSTFNAGNDIYVTALNSPSVKAVTGAVSGSMFASAAITVAEANVGGSDEEDHLKTIVNVDDSNTFTADAVTAKAEAGIKQTVDMNGLSISASPFSGITGAAQVNTGGSEVYSDVDVNIGASVFQGRDSGAADLNVSGLNTVTQIAAAKGISASTGIATGTNLASTAAHLSTQVTAKGNEQSRFGNVDIKGSSYAKIDNDANGYGGALIDISPYAAKVENNYTADTDVTLSGTWKTTGSFTAQALNGMDIDLKSDAVRAAIVGGSGTWLNNVINNSANVILDNATITTDGAQSYVAQNQVDYVGEIDGSGYGGINVNATDYKDDLDFTAGIDIMGSKLTGAGDAGSITAFASTTGDIRTKNNLKSAGVIPVALAFSDHSINYDNSVDVTGSTTLTTDKKDQDITLAATDDTDVKLETIADTQGGAVGAASAKAKNVLGRSNKITVDKGSTLHSTNDVKLYAGANSEGISSSLDLQVLADAYNKTVIPLATAPKVDNAMTQANQVSVGGIVESVRHINASAAKGATTVTESAQEYNLYQGTSGSSTVASTTLGETVPHENGDANFVEVKEGASLTAGIHNKLDLTISGEIPLQSVGEDGKADSDSVDLSNITVTAGAGEDWFDTSTVQKGTTPIKNNLMDRYNEVVRLMSQYEEGTSEYASYKSERDSLLLEMKRMGMAKEDINKNLTPSSEIEVPAVSLPDIVVSGGNINIDSDSLKGGGNLTAQGAPQINITNESDAYLVVNDVTIQDAGGQIRMNGSTLTADTAGNEMSAAQIHAGGVTGGESQINISGTASMKERMQADIGVFGDITNTSGDVTLTNNSYNLNILGNISGRNVSLVATNGSVTQTSAEGFINIGGDPVTKYQFSKDVANAIQEYIYDQFVANNSYTIPEFKTYEEYVNWIKTNIVAGGKYGITEADLIWKKDDPADPGNKIVAGGNVYINGLNVNIGGLVQSGYGKYSVTLDSSAQAKVDALDKEWQGKQEALSDSAVMANEKYLINAGGQVYNQETGVYDYAIRVYYNPSTGELLTDSVSVSGGKIYITGNISSTGGGKIMAMDGAADIAIDTSKIDKNVTVNTITNNDISGLISITDKNKTDGHGHYLVTEYRNDEQRSYYSGGVLSDWSAVTGDMGYDPENGLQYQWTGGVSGEVTKKYQYTEDFLFWGLLDYGESDTFVAGLKAENKMPEGTPVSSGGTAGKENGVVITKGNGGKDFSITGSYSNSSDETYSDISPDMKYDGFWGKVFGYGTTTYTWTGKQGTASSTTTSIAADKHIQIGFIGNGNGSGNISVTSGGDMTLAGNISNASVVDGNSQTVGKGSVSLTSQNGAITGNGIINSDDVNLKAAGDINVNHAAIGSGAAVNIASDNGDIHFTSSKGDLAIEQVVTGGTDPITAETGSVYIEAAGSILDAHTSGDYAVKGQRIDLISKMGSIGTKNNALTILGGSEIYSSDTMASSVNASAKGDIVLTQVDGNMRLGTIASTDGDAVLTVTKGSFVDAHPSENSSSSSAQDKIDRWIESGLISEADTDPNSSAHAADEAKADRVGALEDRMNSLAAEGTHSVNDYKAAAEKLHNSSESLQDAKNAYSQGYQEAYAKHSAAIEQAGGDAAAIETADAAYKQAVEDLTNTYLEAQAKIYGEGFSAEEQQLINSYAETAYSDSYGWSKNQLLYAIQDGVLNAEPGEDVLTVETPNVSANNITLNAAHGSIGVDGEAQFISNDALNYVDNLKILAAAKAGDLTWSDDGVTVRQKQAITVQVKDKGQVDVIGKDNVYLAGVKGTKLDINDIKTTGDIRLQGDNGVDVDSLKGQDLTIAGGTGNIMSSNNEGGYIHTELTGSIDANADGTISFESINGDLKILAAAAGKDLNLKAAEDILMQNVAGSEAQGRINAAEVNLTAGGSIGEAENAIRILDNGVVVNADAVGGIWLSGESGEESTGNLVIGSIKGRRFDLTSVSDISLGRANDLDTEEDERLTGSITTTNGGASISAVNVDLADGRVHTGEYDFNVTADGGNITQSAALAGITANHVNLSSTGSQLLLSEKNKIKSVTVKGLTDDSLTGNVEIHSAADSFAVQFGDKTGDTATGITVNDGSITVHHNGSADGELRVTGSATTKNASSDDSIKTDIVMSSLGSLTSDGALDSAGNVCMDAAGNITQKNSVTAVGEAMFTSDAGSISLTGTTTAGRVEATTESEADEGTITFSGDVTANTGDITVDSNGGAITIGSSAVSEKSYIDLSSETGAITVTGSAKAGGDVTAETKDGSITFGQESTKTGSVTSATGNVTAKTDSGNISVYGTADADKDILFESSVSGTIRVDGTSTAGQHFTAETGSGDIALNGSVKAMDGDVTATSKKGSISTSEDVFAGQNVTVETVSGLIDLGGKVTAKAGAITATTTGNTSGTSGSITLKGDADAAQTITLSSDGGAITVTGSAKADGDVTAETKDGSITFGQEGSADGSVTSESGEVKATTGRGDITIYGTSTAGTDFTAKTDAGDITLDGNITAQTGMVMAQAFSGSISAGGTITSASNTKLTATGVATDDSGNITVNGEIASGKEVHASATNGNIRFEGTTTASAGDVTATVSGDGDITFNGAVTAVSEGDAGGNIAATVSGTGNITTDRDAVFKADKDIQFTTNAGSITTNSEVDAGGNLAFTVETKGDMIVRDDLTAGQNIDLNVNSGNILFEGTQGGVREDIYVTSDQGDVTVSINESGSGDIKDTNGEGETGDRAHLKAGEGNVTVKHDGIGDVDLYEVYAKQDAGISVADGNLHLVDVSGNLVAIFVKSEGKEMDVENIEAAQQIAISGSNMDLDSIKQREDGDGFLVITPEGTADDQPIDNLVIGDILTNGGVRFDHLWLNTGNIHVSEGALHLDKVYVQDKATFSTDDMTTNVFGSAPVYDDSVSSSYWVNTSINSPKDDLAAWNSDELNDKWMHIFFSPEGTVQISNGNLLHLADHNYAYNQRYSQVDWMNLFTDEDFYNFYDKYYAPDLSYHERYGLTSGSGHSVENAEEDEVIVE